MRERRPRGLRARDGPLREILERRLIYALERLDPSLHRAVLVRRRRLEVERGRDGLKVLHRLPCQLSAEGLRRLTGAEAGAGQDDLNPIRRETEPTLEPPDQQRDLRPARAAVEVGLVDDEQQLLMRVPVVILAGLLEDLPFDGPHQHVLKHRIVGDEDVRRLTVHLVAAVELAVALQAHRAVRFVFRAIRRRALREPAAGTEPRGEARLRGPLPELT